MYFYVDCNGSIERYRNHLWDYFIFVVVVVTRSLLTDEGMAEDHGALKLGKSPGLGPEIVESPKSERRKESVAGQQDPGETNVRIPIVA